MKNTRSPYTEPQKGITAKYIQSRKYAVIRLSIFGGLAACLCIAIAVVSAFPQLAGTKPTSNNYDNYNFSYAEPTSDEYEDLELLLADLKENEFIPEDEEGTPVSVHGDNIMSGCILLWDKVYSIDRTGKADAPVLCFDAESGEEIPQHFISEEADSLFVCGSRLACVKNSADSSTVSLYDVYNISKPRKSDTITFNGRIDHCLFSKTNLYVVFNGRKPASEFQGKKDDFLPAVTLGDKTVRASQNTIFGSPKTSNWAAVAVLSTTVTSVKNVQGFFGDIETIYTQNDNITFETRLNHSDVVTQSELYCYHLGEGSTIYHGKLSLEDVFDFKIGTDTSKSSVLPDAADVEFVEHYRITGDKEESIRIAGTVRHHPDNSNTQKSEVFVLDFMPYTVAKYTYTTLQPTGQSVPTVDEVTDNYDKWLITTSGTDKKGSNNSAALLFASFSDRETHLAQTELSLKHTETKNSSDALIPLTGGKYLRCNASHNGFDLYDFSDMEDPVLVTKNAVKLGKGEKYEFANAFYPDEEHIGIAVSSADSKKNTSLRWLVYSIENNRLNKESETTITEKYDSDISFFNTVQIGDSICYVSADKNKLIKTI